MTLSRFIPEGDLAVTQDNKIRLVDGVDYVRQKIAHKFRFLLGEWFRDTRKGLPLKQYVFVKNPNLDVVRAILRSVLRSITEIAEFSEVIFEWDRSTRKLAVGFECVLLDGSALTIAPGDPDFIITVPTIQ